MSGLVIRAPVAPTPAIGPGDFAFDDRFAADGSLRISVPDLPAPPRLEPLFPGYLTFLPDDAAAVPVDPTDAAGPTVPGTLALEMLPSAQRDLRRRSPSLGYRLAAFYHDVALGPDFYPATVFGNVRRRGRSDATLANAFARGQLSVRLRATASDADAALPLMPGHPTGPGRSVVLTLGVRTNANPYEAPPRACGSPP